MAYDQNDPNQQNQPTSNTAGSNQYGSSTPGTSTSTPGTSQTQPTAPGNAQYNQARQQKGTGFTNITQILNANQGYGQKIGQQIGNGLQNQANNVNGAIQTGQNQFNTGAKSAYDTANGAVQSGTALEQQTGESADDYANRLAQSQDYATIGQNISNAKYTGPTALANSGQIQSQAATASALGRLAGTTGGQNQLLSTMVANRGNYNQGDTSLDQLLLGKGGEQYVQQGAQGLSNIGNTANSAIAGAQNQANNYSNAISTNKQNTLAALQNQLSGAGDTTSNNITGFTTLAQKQGTDYNNNVTRLGQLLSGKDQNGNPIDMSKLNDGDKNLLTHLNDYGIGDTSVYEHLNGNAQEGADAQANGLTNYNNVVANNSDAIKAALANLGSNLNISQGGSYYKGNQAKAAENLADLLGQSDTKSSIANNQFNTSNFNPTSAFSGLNAEKTGDQAAQGYYNQQAALGGNIQDVLNQQQSVNQKLGIPDLQKTIATQGVTSDAGKAAQAQLDTVMSSPEYQAAQQAQADLARKLSGQAGIAGTDAEGGSTGQYASNLTPELVALAKQNGNYFTGDAGNQSFSNILNPGNWRNSSYFSNLGNQSVGQDTSLQNYVLQNLLNSGGATS